ncbi:hypothetical protein [Halegenticoccus tardaugens]|uniref:hypothetical protein n=1 Tax=Halegenticoccus tardaugens TaxID=2071624 RepID=UPI00100BA656|nr:hypothetical protein [Halegenticoccus tardaugens]
MSPNDGTDRAPGIEKRVFETFTDDQPRSTDHIVEQVEIERALIEDALVELERQGVLERHEQDRPDEPGESETLWYPV